MNIKAFLQRVSLSFLLSLLVCSPQLRLHAQTPTCVSPPPDLIAWWQAEANFSDWAGINEGINGGAVSFATGEVSQAFAFDGTPNSYIAVPSSPSLEISDVVTIEFWVKRLRLTYPSLPYAEYVVEKGGDWTGGLVDYSAALHNAGYNYCLHFVFANGWRGAGSIADTNAWHHCAIVARNGDADPIFYIDGVEQPIVYREGSPTMNFVVSSRPLHIGAMIDPITGWAYYSQTLVDELSIYRRALTAAEIAGIYNAGVAGKCNTPVPPSILTQPADRTVDAGSTATLSVQALGIGPLVFQWYFQSNLLNGANQPALVLPNVDPSQAGTYFAIVTNRYGSVVSSNAVLTVVTHPPAIVQPPHDSTVYVGMPASLQAVASGSPVLVYQWLKNGTAVLGASRSVYQLAHSQLSDSGAYSLVVTNPYGSITSVVAVLTVREPPPCVPEPAGLIGWWRGENNTLDATGLSDGASLPPPLYTAGKVGQCFARSPFIVPDTLSLRVTNGLTLHAWVNAPLPTTAPRAIAAKYDYPPLVPQGTQSSFYLGVTNNGQFYFAVSSNGAPRAAAFAITTPRLFTGIWTFVAATYDGSKLRLYVNGILEAETNYTGGIFAGMDNLGIGVVPAASGLATQYWPFSGYIDAPRLAELKVVELDPSGYDVLAGQYKIEGTELVATITRDGNHLFGQMPDQPKIELLPKSQTEFGVREVNAQVTFVKDGTGKVTRARLVQSGQTVEASKVN